MNIRSTVGFIRIIARKEGTETNASIFQQTSLKLDKKSVITNRTIL